MSVDPAPDLPGLDKLRAPAPGTPRVAARRVTPPAAPPPPLAELPPEAPATADFVDADTEFLVLPRSRAGGRPARRPAPLVLGVGGAVVAAGLAAASIVSQPALAVAVLLVQVVLSLGWLALIDAPSSGGSFAVAAGAAVATDVLVVTGDGAEDLAPLAGVLGLAMLAALAHQLARRKRVHITESLASTLAIVVLVVSAAQLIALRGVDDGRDAVSTTLAAAAAAMIVGRLLDTLLPKPALADASSRGWFGMFAGLIAGGVAGALIGDALGLPDWNTGALLGIAAAALASTADLAVDLGAAELRAGRRDRRRVDALTPVGMLLPIAAVSPVAYLAGRSLLG